MYWAEREGGSPVIWDVSVHGEGGGEDLGAYSTRIMDF